jgi:hypothetical protein
MSTEVTATISREWKQRMLIICAVLVGLGGWFLFDGLVAYPQNNQKAVVYFEIRERLGKDTPETKAAWDEVRAAKGWSEAAPKKIYSQGDLTTQVVLGLLALGGAAAAGLHFLRSLSTTTRMNNGLITLPDGLEIPISKVRAVSRKRWENKGIADLAWEPEPGRMERFLLDDYKYVGAATILEEVERTLGVEKPAGETPSDTAATPES